MAGDWPAVVTKAAARRRRAARSGKLSELARRIKAALEGDIGTVWVEEEFPLSARSRHVPVSHRCFYVKGCHGSVARGDVPQRGGRGVGAAPGWTVVRGWGQGHDV